MPKTYRIVDPSGLDPRGGPKQLVRAAEAAGFVVEVRTPRKVAGHIAVGGVNPVTCHAFIASWVDGKTIGATFYSERDEGYDEVPAPKTRLEGRGTDRRRKMTGYVNGTRLVSRGGPRGVAVSITELKARMSAL